MFRFFFLCILMGFVLPTCKSGDHQSPTSDNQDESDEQLLFETWVESLNSKIPQNRNQAMQKVINQLQRDFDEEKWQRLKYIDDACENEKSIRGLVTDTIYSKLIDSIHQDLFQEKKFQYSGVKKVHTSNFQQFLDNNSSLLTHVHGYRKDLDKQQEFKFLIGIPNSYADKMTKILNDLPSYPRYFKELFNEKMWQFNDNNLHFRFCEYRENRDANTLKRCQHFLEKQAIAKAKPIEHIVPPILGARFLTEYPQSMIPSYVVKDVTTRVELNVPDSYYNSQIALLIQGKFILKHGNKEQQQIALEAMQEQKLANSYVSCAPYEEVQSALQKAISK